MREAQEHEAFDRHLASLPKLLCGCSVGTGCDGAHARRPAKHGDSAKLSVADAHQLRILKDTVRNPLKGQFLGGPSAEEAEETLRSKFRFTSEQIRNLKGGARHGDMSSRGGEERHDYEHRGAPFVVGTDTRGDRTRWLYWIKGMSGAGPYFSTRGAAVTGAKKRIDAALDKEWPGIFRPDVGWLSGPHHMEVDTSRTSKRHGDAHPHALKAHFPYRIAHTADNAALRGRDVVFLRWVKDPGYWGGARAEIALMKRDGSTGEKYVVTPGLLIASR